MKAMMHDKWSWCHDSQLLIYVCYVHKWNPKSSRDDPYLPGSPGPWLCTVHSSVLRRRPKAVLQVNWGQPISPNHDLQWRHVNARGAEIPKLNEEHEHAITCNNMYFQRVPVPFYHRFIELNKSRINGRPRYWSWHVLCESRELLSSYPWKRFETGWLHVFDQGHMHHSHCEKIKSCLFDGKWKGSMVVGSCWLPTSQPWVSTIRYTSTSRCVLTFRSVPFSLSQLLLDMPRTSDVTVQLFVRQVSSGSRRWFQSFTDIWIKASNLWLAFLW